MSNALRALLLQLNDATVRDLAWALASPNLISGSALAPDHTWYQELLVTYQPRLLQLDKHPDVLHRHCQPHRRLGFYFEALWHFFLLDSPRFHVLAHDWQQVFDGTTIGAFDFLVWDTQFQRIEHWELAVKFYLISQQDDAFDHAYGINPRDKLRRKHQHMLTHQLMLSKCPQVSERLEQQGLQPTHRRLILKGRLYYPRDCQQFISNEGERGYWGIEPPGPEFIAQHKLGWLTGSHSSQGLDRRQSFVDNHNNWYIQVDQDWLNSIKETVNTPQETNQPSITFKDNSL